MELYIVFYQRTILGYAANESFAICNNIEDVKKQFKSFIEIAEWEAHDNIDAFTVKNNGIKLEDLEFDTVSKDDFYQITSKDDYSYNAVVSYARIPFNFMFSLEELIK